MVKFALVLDKSQAYLNFQRERLLKEWQVDKSDTQSAKSLKSIGSATLFGGVPTSIINIERTEDVKTLVEELESSSPETLSATFEAGLIITCNADRRYTKKLEAIVKKLGGQVTSPPSGKSEESVPVKLVKELGLKPSVRDFLLQYVGQDVEAVLPMLESLSAIPREYHSRITEEDIYYRMPQPPGSVPPWEIEKFVFAGDVGKAIEIARRINQHSSYLLWLAVLKKKVTTAYRAAQLLTIQPSMSDNDLAAALGVPTKGLYFTKKNAKSYGPAKLEKAMMVIAQGEAKIKGASAAPGEAVSEMMLVELCHIMGGR